VDYDDLAVPPPLAALTVQQAIDNLKQNALGFAELETGSYVGTGALNTQLIGLTFKPKAVTIIRPIFFSAETFYQTDVMPAALFTFILLNLMLPGRISVPMGSGFDVTLEANVLGDLYYFTAQG
jgi:hypothetical protein